MESSSGSSVDTSLHSPDGEQQTDPAWQVADSYCCIGIATVLAPIRLDTPPPFLSTLPTELIREILESTVTRTFHSTTYQERQNTLYSLSLVSNLFRSIAQPLLLEIVWIKSVEQIEVMPVDITLTSGGGEVRRRVQVNTVVLDLMVDSLEKYRRLKAAIQKLTLVEATTVHARHCHYYGISLLKCFRSRSLGTSLSGSEPTDLYSPKRFVDLAPVDSYDDDRSFPHSVQLAISHLI